MSEHSPVAQRSSLQAARTCVRQTMTALCSGITAWEDASATGRTSLSALSNTHLRLLHLPELKVSKLAASPSDVERLMGAAERKLLHQLHADQDALQESLRILTEAAKQMSTSVRQLEVHATEAAAIQGMPVFVCLTVSQIFKLADAVVTCYLHQLEVRARPALLQYCRLYLQTTVCEYVLANVASITRFAWYATVMLSAPWSGRTDKQASHALLKATACRSTSTSAQRAARCPSPRAQQTQVSSRTEACREEHPKLRRCSAQNRTLPCSRFAQACAAHEHPGTLDPGALSR